MRADRSVFLSTETREKLKARTRDLKDFAAWMRGLLEGLPPVSDEAQEEGETPEGELQGLLECLLFDDLEPAIRKLESVDQLGEPEAEGDEEDG
ncbi:MAG TPA: hypothetical protein VGH73_15670 [Thermoanaerobaculia bacterium]|jgi:hypothetical protein